MSLFAHSARSTAIIQVENVELCILNPYNDSTSKFTVSPFHTYCTCKFLLVSSLPEHGVYVDIFHKNQLDHVRLIK